MLKKSINYNELSRLVWKEYASRSHDDKKLKELFNEDEAYWKYLGNQYVEGIWEGVEDIHYYLENISDKSRKKIYKILIKEYFHMHKIEPTKISKISLTDEKLESLIKNLKSK